MSREENYNCLGKWVYEDIDCMMCSKSSECTSIKRNKEIEYARSKHHKDCSNCHEITKCRSYSTMVCFGDVERYEREDECYKCNCNIECWKKCKKEIKVLCIKSIKCSIHGRSKAFIKFDAGSDYDMIAIGTRIYAKDNYGIHEKIFEDYTSEIFPKYFIIQS